MKSITVRDFCDRFHACESGRAWALAQPERTMADLWRRRDLKPEWRVWIATRTGVMSDLDLRLFACWCATSTPLGDGRVSGALLTDPRSKRAVKVACLHALGLATDAELAAAWDAARAAARDAARAAAWDAAWAAAWAARAAARAAAGAAQAAQLLVLMPEWMTTAEKETPK